jgi:hypothetical protein
VDPNGNSLLTSGLPSTSPTLVDLDTLLGPYTPVEALELGLIGRGDAVFTAIYEDTGGRVLLIDTTPSNDARLRVRARRAGEGEVFGAPLLPELPETLPSTGGVMAALLGLPLLLVVLVGGSAVLFALAKRRRRV